MKAPIQMPESRFLASLHKDVRTGCPDTPPEAQVRLKSFRERERERELTVSYHFFSYSRVFIIFKCGAKFCSDGLAFAVMIAQ